jgi:adenylate kinase
VDNDPPRKEGVCDNDGSSLVQRHDDREEVVARRLRAYEEQTSPLVGYYRRQANVVRVDGNRPMEVVFADLLTKMGVAA